MRVMGLDYGSKTVGVAISDPLGITAQGIETIHRKAENKLRQTLARIEELVKEYEVDKLVLGFPKHMNNTKDEVEFFVLEQTKVNGNSYILVTDSEEDEAECLILKDTSAAEDVESLYEVVEDENELMGVLKVFEELLEDIDIDM